MTRKPPSRSSTRRLNDILAASAPASGSAPDTSLGRLLTRARFLARLESLLSDCVSPELAHQFQVAAVRGNRLILISPTAAWATRLRMHSAQMLGLLQTTGHADIRQIDVRVAPFTRPAPPSRHRRPLSPAAKQAIDLMTRYTREGED